VNNGKFYIGNLGLFPITPDSGKVMSFNIGSCPRPFLFGFGCGDELQKLRLFGSRAGFTTVVAVDFGKVVRLNRAGDIEDVATGLSLPTGMTFGPDGYLCVSNFGATPTGQILRISVHWSCGHKVRPIQRSSAGIGMPARFTFLYQVQ
jgi:hypothetical protein